MDDYHIAHIRIRDEYTCVTVEVVGRIKNRNMKVNFIAVPRIIFSLCTATTAARQRSDNTTIAIGATVIIKSLEL